MPPAPIVPVDQEALDKIEQQKKKELAAAAAVNLVNQSVLPYQAVNVVNQGTDLVNKALNPGGGSGSSSSGGGSGPNYNSMYNELKTAISGMKTANLAGIDSSIANVKKQYGDSTNDLYDRYVGSRTDLADRAGTLGVDLQNSSTGSLWDAALRRLKEMSDQNLNSDVAYFEKMKGLGTNAFDALLMGVDQDKLARMSGGSGGGGGSYRRGGGSGSISESANQTGTVNNVGDAELYNELLRTDPWAAKLYYDSYWGSGGDPIDALKLLQNKLTDDSRALANLPTFVNKLATGVNNLAQNNKYEGNASSFLKVFNTASKYAPAVAKQSASSNAMAQAAMKALTGLWGNPKIVQKTTQKS